MDSQQNKTKNRHFFVQQVLFMVIIVVLWWFCCHLLLLLLPIMKQRLYWFFLSRKITMIIDNYFKSEFRFENVNVMNFFFLFNELIWILNKFLINWKLKDFYQKKKQTKLFYWEIKLRGCNHYKESSSSYRWSLLSLDWELSHHHLWFSAQYSNSMLNLIFFFEKKKQHIAYVLNSVQIKIWWKQTKFNSNSLAMNINVNEEDEDEEPCPI